MSTRFPSFLKQWECWLGLGIFTLGVLLRVIHLQEHNLWMDEYVGGVGFLHVPSYHVYTTLINVLCFGISPPVYPLLQYGWAHVAGDNVLLLRLLPLSFGFACMPLMYAATARVFGRSAGLLAMFCFAVSPSQLFIAKTLRPYALVMFLSVLSAYLLVRAIQDGRARWWIACLLVNTVAVFSHFFCLFLVCVEMLSLVAMLRAHFRLVVLWSIAQLLCIAPLFAQMFTGPPMIVMWQPFHLRDFIDSFSGESIPGLAGLFGLLTLLLVAILLKDIRRNGFPPAPPLSRTQSPFMLFFLLLASGPVLLATAMQELSGVSFLVPRYVCFVAIGRFAVAGAVMASVSKRVSRLAIAGIVAVFCLCDLIQGYPATLLTHWSSAASYIKKESSPRDPVVTGAIWDPSYLRANGWDLPNPFLTGNNFQTACDVCVSALTQKKAAAEEQRRVWLIYTQCRDQGPIPALEAKLRALGFSFTFHQILGWENLAVYGVSRGGAAPGTLDCLTEDQRAHCQQELNDLGLGNVDPMEREKYTQILLRFLPDDSPYNYEILDEWQRVFFLLRIGELKLAEAYAHKHEEEPALMGFVLRERGDQKGAKEAFGRAKFFDAPNLEMFGGVVARLIRNDENAACYQECRAVEKTGHVTMIPYRDFFWARMHPQETLLPFGTWATRDEDHLAMAPLLTHSEWDLHASVNERFTLAVALELRGRTAEAASLYQNVAADIPDGAPVCKELEAALARCPGGVSPVK